MQNNIEPFSPDGVFFSGTERIALSYVIPVKYYPKGAFQKYFAILIRLNETLRDQR